MSSEASAALVFVAAAGTALATGLGAVPLAFARRPGREWLGAANALASGVMVAASVSLAIEGFDRSGTRTVVGAVAGAAFLQLIEPLLRRHPSFGSLHGELAVAPVLVVTAMTAHSVAEGVGVGAAFAGGGSFGVLIAIAIALHNIPEGLAISLVLVPRGTSVRSAAGWSIFSSLPQPLLAVPAYLFVEWFSGVLPLALGFAAGAMVWLVLRELLPEALHSAHRSVVVGYGVGAFAVMLAAQLLMLR